jgi:hypothetical protein
MVQRILDFGHVYLILEKLEKAGNILGRFN